MDFSLQAFNLTEVPWLVMLKWLSIIINIVILVKWILRKIILNKFLLGRWEGNIINSETEAKLDCILIITACPERVNKAFFYYEQIFENEITVRGVDQLHDYDNDPLFFWNKKWRPYFFRQFHIGYNDAINAKEIDFAGNIKYNWECDVLNIWAKPKLKVSIGGNGVNLNGVLHKS